MHFLSFPFLVFVYLLSIRPCGCPQGTSLEWVDCVWSALCYWRTEPCLFTFMLKTSLLQSTYTSEGEEPCPYSDMACQMI